MNQECNNSMQLYEYFWWKFSATGAVTRQALELGGDEARRTIAGAIEGQECTDC